VLSVTAAPVQANEGLPLCCRCASLTPYARKSVLNPGFDTMTELGDSLERMSFMQLLLLFGFVTCYVLALGGMFGSAVRLRAAALALLQAAVFTALTDPWVHGALLVVFVVAGLGLFVMLSWLLARLLAPRPVSLPLDSQAESAADATAQPPRPADGLGAAPKLGGGRARATR
jgi:hypothetical protein